MSHLHCHFVSLEYDSRPLHPEIDHEQSAGQTYAHVQKEETGLPFDQTR